MLTGVPMPTLVAPGAGVRWTICGGVVSPVFDPINVALEPLVILLPERSSTFVTLTSYDRLCMDSCVVMVTVLPSLPSTAESMCVVSPGAATTAPVVKGVTISTMA
jgi:hypothetical protein